MIENSSYRCPQCGYEYEPWVEVCPDCNVPVRQMQEEAPIEHSNPALGEGDDPQWTVAANVPNAIIGSLIKSQLEDAGIPVIMMRSRSADIAEFSHNDYVPQDIRVPAHLRELARQLIYATPDTLPFTDDSYEDDEQPDDNAPPYRSSLPEGWSLLPGEEEMRSRRELTAGRGETPREWYWSDEHPQEAAAHEPESQREEEPVWDWRTELGNANRHARGASGDDHEWPKTQKWIRVLYGIMLLAITLPFLLQLLEQLARFFNR